MPRTSGPPMLPGDSLIGATPITGITLMRAHAHRHIKHDRPGWSLGRTHSYIGRSGRLQRDRGCALTIARGTDVDLSGTSQLPAVADLDFDVSQDSARIVSGDDVAARVLVRHLLWVASCSALELRYLTDPGLVDG